MMNAVSEVQEFQQFIADAANQNPYANQHQNQSLTSGNTGNSGAAGSSAAIGANNSGNLDQAPNNITNQLIQRATRNLAQQSSQQPGMLNNTMQQSFGASPPPPAAAQPSPAAPLTPELLAEAALAMDDMVAMRHSPTDQFPQSRLRFATPAQRRMSAMESLESPRLGRFDSPLEEQGPLRRRTRRADADSPGENAGGRILGGGLFGARPAGGAAGGGAAPPPPRAGAAPRGNADEEDNDPLLEPVTAAAVIAHCAASDTMTNPRQMVKKSLLLGTIMASKDIRPWRAILTRKNIMDDATAQATRTKQELFDALTRECPFC